MVVQFVIGFVRFVVQNHMNMVAFLSGGILVWLVAFEISSKMKFDLHHRATYYRALGWRNDMQLRLRFILLPTNFLLVENGLGSRYDL